MNDSRIADELCKEDFEDLYECGSCDAIHQLSEFEDTECDGDIIGKCPSCGKKVIIIPVNNEDLEDLELI